MRSFYWIGGLLIVLLLAGCAPLVSSFPTATLPPQSPTPVTPTATITPTPTIVWFPATETPTLLPTAAYTPTPDLIAGLGPLDYSDDFNDAELWITYQIVNSSVTVMNGDITLALNQPTGGIYAFRVEPILEDFYAEITASPSYCGSADEYGLMLRVTGDRQDHYRLVISCSGQVSMMRVVNERGLQIAAPVSHPLLPTSFPAVRRLGVWVQGRTLRVFVDGVFLFAVEDAVIQRGSVGVFATAKSEAPMLINFLELEVYSLAGEAP